MNVNDHYQRVGYEGYEQIAHVLPLPSLMYPFSPQAGPQEFLIFQKSALAPTNKTPWLTDVPQDVMIPPLY